MRRGMALASVLVDLGRLWSSYGSQRQDIPHRHLGLLRRHEPRRRGHPRGDSCAIARQRFRGVTVFSRNPAVQHSHGVVAHMRFPERAEILRRRYSPRQILDLMGRFDFAVGMRLHFLIFAALRGTPFSALPYASKVTGLLEDLDMDTPPLGSIGIGELCGRIDRKWDTREAIRAKLGERVPGLRRRAKLTNEALLRVLEHK